VLLSNLQPVALLRLVQLLLLRLELVAEGSEQVRWDRKHATQVQTVALHGLLVVGRAQLQQHQHILMQLVLLLAHAEEQLVTIAVLA
jgi:hypothetical protein